jgi:hypothetical protein
MENEFKLDESVKAEIDEHLRGLDTSFGEHFPATLDNINSIRNHFIDTAVLTPYTLGTEEKEQLI